MIELIIRLTDEQLAEIAERAAALVSADHPIVSPWLNVAEAAERLRCRKDRIYALADPLRGLDTAADDFVFCTATGTVLDPDNLAMRALVPACKAAGVEWAGFHTFRHTVASRLLRKAGMSCRCSAGLATTRPASRSTPTSTCSTTTSASRSSLRATRARIRLPMLPLPTATTIRMARP